MLQAYALQNILSNYVCDAEVILIDPVDRKVSPINELCYKIRNIFLLNKFKTRKKAMRNFQLNYVKHSKYYTESNILEANNEYTAFVTGSDIVWCNPLEYNSYIYWLLFTNDNKYRFSYAASIGQDYTILQKNVANKYIQLFDAVSVRENQAKNQINKSEREIISVLDPTLLYEREKWNDFCSDRLYSDDYVFSFVFGDSKLSRNEIRYYAKSNNLKLITLPFMLFDINANDMFFGDIKLYNVSPQDFVSLIKHAKIIFTDSYHGVIFSLIFHKQFRVINRIAKYDTRISDLFDKFNIDQEKIRNIFNDYSVDYTSFEKLLTNYKSVSFEYIMHIKDILDENTKGSH